MQHLDERILEYLHERGWASPGLITDLRGVDASEARVRERFLVLSHVGFAAPLHGDEPSDIDMVVITRLGGEFLRGDLDARHHRPPPRTRRSIGGGHPATVYMNHHAL
jgi:hypothetical protein